MLRVAALPMVALSACGTSGSPVAVQSPERIVATYGDVIVGCSAALSDAGVIDQKALAASGWHAASRTARLGGDERTLATDAYPVLRAGEYEATRWLHPEHDGALELIRWDERSATREMDHCLMQARVDDDAGLARVVAGIGRRFGRAPDRTGAVPRGGDFLTPRSDPQRTGHYWAMPRHDVYLETSPDGFVGIDVVAMPDRKALDEYSPDRPESRVVILPGDPQP